MSRRMVGSLIVSSAVLGFRPMNMMVLPVKGLSAKENSTGNSRVSTYR